ncbi:hypothetical protein [Methyloversatilis discipulorum]|uniref:hypothetical protein n=1 Tax=Methyloversatilis discipulorum TaxID=1119528 RepID=UPI003F3DAE6B
MAFIKSSNEQVEQGTTTPSDKPHVTPGGPSTGQWSHQPAFNAMKQQSREELFTLDISKADTQATSCITERT